MVVMVVMVEVVDGAHPGVVVTLADLIDPVDGAALVVDGVALVADGVVHHHQGVVDQELLQVS